MTRSSTYCTYFLRNLLKTFAEYIHFSVSFPYQLSYLKNGLSVTFYRLWSSNPRKCVARNRKPTSYMAIATYCGMAWVGFWVKTGLLKPRTSSQLLWEGTDRLILTNER